MAESAVEIARSACSAAGVEAPPSLVGGAGAAPQLRAFLNRTGKELASLRGSYGQPWPELAAEENISAEPGVEWYALPEDFSEVVQGTAWDAGERLHAPGPEPPQSWQALQISDIYGSLNTHWRVAFHPDTNVKRVQINPVPDRPFNFRFAYATKRWVRNSPAGALVSDAVSQDSDVAAFEDVLMELGLEWRLRKAYGLPFASELAEYELQRDRYFGRATAVKPVMVGRELPALHEPYIPEGSWGVR